MRPANVRRIGIAAVAGCLLLASGTVPGYARDVEKAEGTPPTRVADSAWQADLGSWIQALLADGARGLEVVMGRAACWANLATIRVVHPVPVDRGRRGPRDLPPAPAKVIVDDGAPF